MLSNSTLVRRCFVNSLYPNRPLDRSNFKSVMWSDQFYGLTNRSVHILVDRRPRDTPKSVKKREGRRLWSCTVTPTIPMSVMLRLSIGNALRSDFSRLPAPASIHSRDMTVRAVRSLAGVASRVPVRAPAPLRRGLSPVGFVHARSPSGHRSAADIGLWNRCQLLPPDAEAGCRGFRRERGRANLARLRRVRDTGDLPRRGNVVVRPGRYRIPSS